MFVPLSQLGNGFQNPTTSQIKQERNEYEQMVEYKRNKKNKNYIANVVANVLSAVPLAFSAYFTYLNPSLYNISMLSSAASNLIGGGAKKQRTWGDTGVSALKGVGMLYAVGLPLTLGVQGIQNYMQPVRDKADLSDVFYEVYDPNAFSTGF